MDHGTARIVLQKVFSLPPNVNLPDFDGAGYHSAAQQENRQRFVQLAIRGCRSRAACMASASGALGIPALATADVGIVIGAGPDLAIESLD